MVAVVGFVLPVSGMLNGTDTSEEYIVVFYCAMVVLGVICLLAIWIILACCTGKTKGRGLKDNTYDITYRNEKADSGTNVCVDRLPVPALAVYYKKDGASLFVLIGAIFFGMGYLLHMIFTLASDCRISHAVEHYITHSFTAFLVLLQTGVLLYYNKACINIHKGWVTYALCHLIAVNLCAWIMIVVIGIAEEIKEAAHALSESEHEDGEGGHIENATHHHGVTESHADIGGVESQRNTLATSRDGSACTWSHTLLERASPFLIPCVIEYTLIMTAILYGMLTSLGRTVNREETQNWAGVKNQKTPIVLAVVLGCLLLGVAIVCGAVAFRMDSHQGLKVQVVFHSGELLLSLVSLIAMAVSFWQMKGLGIQPLESFFDITLLLVAYAAFNIVEMFTLVPAIWEVNIHDHPDDTQLAQFALGRHIFELIQGFVQVLYILAGAGRYTRNRAHASRHPGRVAIMLILFANLGMWLLRVLDEDLKFRQEIWEDYFGNLAWTIIKSSCSPLVIFFRFHSCVCLADMAREAYKPKRD